MGLRVLMPFWHGAPEGGFYRNFVSGISDALLELGHEPSYFPFHDRVHLSANECTSLAQQIERDRPVTVLDVACWGYGASRVSARPNKGRNGPESLFDDYNIAYAGMLLDQPFNQPINAVAASRLYGIYPDLGHPQQVKILYPYVRLAGEIIAPPGVRPTSAGSGADRPTDILYVGNLERIATTRFWRQPAFQSANPNLSSGFCDALVDVMAAEPERSLHRSLETVRRQHLLPEGFDFQENLRVVEHHVRHVLRLKVILALAKSGLRLHVVGNEWRNLDLPATVKVQESTDYQGFLGLASTAKICVDASTYLDGVNDRVFSYAVNGAICYTNAGGYLRPMVGDDASIRFYSMLGLDVMADNVRELLARPAELAELGARARAMALGAHTWRHRVEHILAGMAQ